MNALPKRLTRFLSSVAAAVALLLMLAPSAHANLMNGDFSNGLAHWQAERIDSVTFAPDVVAAVGPDIMVTGGVATMANSLDFFELSLRQTFILPADSGTFGFDYAWTKTDEFFDLAEITVAFGGSVLDLIVAGGVDPLVPSASGRIEVDVSALAGQQLTLTALLQDGDFNEADTLSVGNFLVTPRPVVGVPSPATLPLLLLALIAPLGLGRLRR